ncbi:mechanosensitive ion channel domain-containing protein [Agarivorans sp. QJM3NY_33]|uniref:mechanosensitive ion channel domain-containing protein n=1 Tax=Agarivorans sp. QJM3NY_33 TaxID=3421432 RepID=UPI003D7DE538
MKTEFVRWYQSLMKWVLLFFSSAVFCLHAADSGSDQAQLLLEKYQRQQQRIEKIQANRNTVSAIEQAAIDYRLVERHLSSFETINQLTQYLIKQQALGLTEPAINHQVKQIIVDNYQSLIQRIEQQQQLFNKAYAQQPSDNIKSFQLYIDYLNRSDVIFSALVQQINNLQALGFEVTDQNHHLIDLLYLRAESFSGMVGLLENKTRELSQFIKLTPDDQALKDQLAVVKEQLSVAGLSFKLTVELLTQLGFNTGFYQQTLLKLGGQITTDVLDINVLNGIAKRWVVRLSEYFVEHGGEWIFKIFLLLLIYFVFRALARLTRKLLIKSLDSSKLRLSSLMKEMIVSSVTRVVVIVGILFALAQVGISLAPVLAGLGVAGFIIGFALQDTLSNFAAGMMILIYRPYDVGDMVEVGGGVFGKVKSMNLVSTTILTIDNQTLVIPNGKIWGDVIKNVTAQKLRRVDLVFGIGYSDDIDKTEAVLNELLAKHPLVLAEPAPMVKLHILNESSVDFIVRPWVKTDDYWNVYWDITRQVKMRFDQDGISIPFPQRDVHVYSTGNGGEGHSNG